MRTRAKQKHVASDRARRENVPRHILFMFHRKLRPMKQKYSHGCIPGAKQDSCQSRCILARGSRKQNIYEGKQN